MALFTGTPQRDTLNGSGANDTLNGLGGNDRIITGDGADVVDGGDGNDEVNSFASGSGRSLFPANGPKTIHGGLGDDYLTGGGSADQIFGDDGADALFGDGGSDRLDGGTGNDTLDGDDGNDTLVGGDGNDRILTGAGTDRVEAGEGDDTVNGYPNETGRVLFPATGPKTIFGGRGNDFLIGGSSGDSLFGEDGDDSLFGDGGNDTLDGGLGADVLDGGTGDDTYILRNPTQQIEDSGGVDTVVVAGDFIKLPRSIENVRMEAGVQALPYWVDALLPDAAAGQTYARYLGGNKTMFYAFPTQRPSYDTDPSRGQGWTPLTTAQQARVLEALKVVAGVIDVRFEATTMENRANVMTFATNRQTGSSGYAYYPNEGALGSDVYLDNSSTSPNNTSFADGTYGALTLIHEIGHALGLKHPFAHTDSDGDVADPPYLTGREETTAWTVMSYNDSPAQYRLQLSPLDIAALHYLYGPSPSARPGADRYTIDPSQPNFIWDGGGMDVLSAATATGPATLYLTPGYWGWIGAQKGTAISDAGQVTVNFGTVIEVLEGSAFDDRLFGSEIANTLIGGAGNDTLEGGAGDDRLLGGDGLDVARFAGSGSRYALAWDGASLQLRDRLSSGGTDTLVDIERLQFTDRTVELSSRSHTSFSDLPPSIYQFFILAFGAAPGVEYLQQCADAYRGIMASAPSAASDPLAHAQASAQAVLTITRVFTTKSQFTDTYPTTLTHAQLAEKLVANVVGSSATASATAQAVRDITTAMDNGLPLGNMVYQVFSNLAALRGDATWGNTAQLFFNQIAVAKHYSEVLNQSTTDLATLRSVLAGVTPQSDVSTDAALVQLVGVGLLGSA